MQASHESRGDRRRAHRTSSEVARWGGVAHDETGPWRRSSDPRPARTLEAQVELGERVARGATSVVHRARHRELDVDVAVKVLDERHVEDVGIIARLEREARMLVTLRHPGIVRVLDLTRLADGRRALVMEWLAGESLEQRLRREARIPTDEAVSIAISVCRSLAFAHARCVMHRDVKPSNVMLTADDRTVLIDFGVARGPGTSTETVTGGLLGTPAYMAPEQARDASRVTPAADVYSVGAMLFRMLAGEPPYPPDDPWATLHRLANERPRALSALVGGVAPELTALVDECLARDPSMRPVDAGQLLQRLENLSSVDVKDAALALTPHPRLILTSGAVVVALAASAAVGGSLAHPLRPEAVLLLGLVGVATLASALVWLSRERSRGASTLETERRLAAHVMTGARLATIAAGIASIASSIVAGFGGLDVRSLATFGVGLLVFARSVLRTTAASR